MIHLVNDAVQRWYSGCEMVVCVHS